MRRPARALHSLFGVVLAGWLSLCIACGGGGGRQTSAPASGEPEAGTEADGTGLQLTGGENDALPDETRWGTGQSSDMRNHHALLIGVGNYEEATSGLRPLRFPENDIDELERTLLKLGYPETNIIVMTPTRGANAERLNPRRDNILAALDTFLEARETSDKLLIVFSGHGIQKNGDNENYFCPAGTRIDDLDTMVRLREIYQKLEACRAGFKLMLCDACRNDPHSELSRGRPTIDDDFISSWDPPPSPTSTAAFFSCSPSEKAYEDPGKGHGVFLYYFMRAIEGDADDNRDGIVTVEEMRSFTASRVVAHVRKHFENNEQNPNWISNITESGIVLSKEPQAAPVGRGVVGGGPAPSRELQVALAPGRVFSGVCTPYNSSSSPTAFQMTFLSADDAGHVRALVTTPNDNPCRASSWTGYPFPAAEGKPAGIEFRFEHALSAERSDYDSITPAHANWPNTEPRLRLTASPRGLQGELFAYQKARASVTLTEASRTSRPVDDRRAVLEMFAPQSYWEGTLSYRNDPPLPITMHVAEQPFDGAGIRVLICEKNNPHARVTFIGRGRLAPGMVASAPFRVTPQSGSVGSAPLLDGSKNNDENVVFRVSLDGQHAYGISAYGEHLTLKRVDPPAPVLDLSTDGFKRSLHDKLAAGTVWKGTLKGRGAGEHADITMTVVEMNPETGAIGADFRVQGVRGFAVGYRGMVRVSADRILSFPIVMQKATAGSNKFPSQIFDADLRSREINMYLRPDGRALVGGLHSEAIELTEIVSKSGD